MQYNNCELNVLIKGRKATEFQSPMNFQTYIEGRDGSEFELEFVNNNNFDVEAILSVDGLSITDGKPAGTESSGYMVRANSRTSIPGWMVDGSTAAKFAFSGNKGGSYAEQSEAGDERNKGVIGVKVFARKHKPNTYNTFHAGYPKGARGFNSGYSGYSGPVLGSSGAYRSMAIGSVTSSGIYSSGMNVASASALPGVATPVEPQNFEPVEQSLGTAFGDATTFNTTTVDFERGDLTAMMVLYYDDRQGLKRRGIDVTRTQKVPSPFPADEPKGCKPPANWGK